MNFMNIKSVLATATLLLMSADVFSASGESGGSIYSVEMPSSAAPEIDRPLLPMPPAGGGSCVSVDLARATDDQITECWGYLVIRAKDTRDTVAADASYQLGVLCLNGVRITKNERKAAKWFKTAAEKGHAEAAYQLGMLYLNGKGVPEDLRQAMCWFQKAADKDHPEAKSELGGGYLRGEGGLSKDNNEAFKLFTCAAAKGCVMAEYDLGYCYANGIGVVASMPEAVKWWGLAAEKGWSDAQNNLGSAYENGSGVEKDMRAAIEFYRSAAKQGHAGAQFNLAGLYERNVLGKNIAKAIELYKLAAAGGISQAQEALTRLGVA